jgi:hypothetical protein
MTCSPISVVSHCFHATTAAAAGVVCYKIEMRHFMQRQQQW